MSATKEIPVELGWKKDAYGYVTCLMCGSTVNPTLSSMLAHVDARAMAKDGAK